MAPFGAERIVYGDISLGCGDKFDCLGDVICAGGGVEAAVITRIRSGWRNFQLLPPLTSRGSSLQLKG